MQPVGGMGRDALLHDATQGGALDDVFVDLARYDLSEDKFEARSGTTALHVTRAAGQPRDVPGLMMTVLLDVKCSSIASSVFSLPSPLILRPP